MVVRSLAIVAAVWLAGCASGGDVGDPGGGGPGLGDAATGDDGPNLVDGNMVRSSDSGAHGGGDTGTSTGAESSTGDDGSSGDDGGNVGQDSGAADTGGGVVDTGSPPPDSGSPTICNSSNPIYAVEAATEVTSGHFTLCLSGTGCAANQCCYEELSPGNVCVTR